MNIQTDNFSISFKGYDVRPLRGFLLTSNYGNIAKELQLIGKQHGFDVFVLGNSDLSKDIRPWSNNEHRTDIWAQDLWTVSENKLLCFYREFSDKRTELFKKFFNLHDCPVQMTKREKLINFDTKELEHRLYIGIEDNRLLPNFESYYDACDKTHIAGGNIFLTKGENGKNNLIIGEDEIGKFTPEELKETYNAGKICFVPQLDYHLDLFIKPLRDNVVLLADELLTEKLLKKFESGLEKIIKKTPEQKPDSILDFLLKFLNNEKPAQEGTPSADYYKTILERVRKCISTNEVCRQNQDEDINQVEEALNKAGYKVVKVPANIHRAVYSIFYEKSGWFRKRRCLNYINACTFLNEKNEIVYITNKDILEQELNIPQELLKKTGIDFEEEFKKSVKDYIKPENIYFLSGEDNSLGRSLLNQEGGLHCLTTEIPVG